MMKKSILVVAALFLLTGAPVAQAQGFRWGPEVSLGTDTDLGLGARIEFDLNNSPLTIIGSFDYYFPDGPVKYWEINGNLIYNFDVPSAPSVTPYAGGGLNIAHASVDGDFGSASDTDPGLNLLGGARFDAGSLMPFVEMKFTIEGADQFVVTGGLLF
jgi:hypothetical protein